MAKYGHLAKYGSLLYIFDLYLFVCYDEERFPRRGLLSQETMESVFSLQQTSRVRRVLDPHDHVYRLHKLLPIQPVFRRSSYCKLSETFSNISMFS